MIELRCQKKLSNMYFRIIIIVSFPKMQCAFWQCGWPFETFLNQFWSYRGRDNMHNCVNNKMLEYMWLSTAPLSGLINCFKSELQEFTSHMNLLSWQLQVQTFRGFTDFFLAIGVLTVNYNSSFWDLRLIWVTFENNSEKMTQCIYVLLTWRREKKPLESHYFALW